MLKTIIKKIADYNAGKELEKAIPVLKVDSENKTAIELVDLLYSNKWERFFWIKQLKQEILDLTLLVEEIKPKVIVEIGTNMGGSLFLFTKVADKNALIISIDLPEGPGGGGYPSYRDDFYKSFAVEPKEIHLIKDDSYKQEVLELLKNILNGREIDFLFLDGDHAYEGIKMDFDMYTPLVKKGGWVGFHDIKPSLPDNWRQVGPFWEKIKNNYNYKEFLDHSLSWGGIGVVQMK